MAYFHCNVMVGFNIDCYIQTSQPLGRGGRSLRTISPRNVASSCTHLCPPVSCTSKTTVSVWSSTLVENCLVPCAGQAKFCCGRISNNHRSHPIKWLQKALQNSGGIRDPHWAKFGLSSLVPRAECFWYIFLHSENYPMWNKLVQYVGCEGIAIWRTNFIHCIIYRDAANINETSTNTDKDIHRIFALGLKSVSNCSYPRLIYQTLSRLHHKAVKYALDPKAETSWY